MDSASKIRTLQELVKDVGHPHPAGPVGGVVGDFDVLLPVGVGPDHHPCTETEENGSIDSRAQI